jgi:hypothetical protein
MLRLKIIFILFFFLFWLIPLGAFIKPYQETLACGGQRAICLCLHHFQKSSDGQKVVLVNPGTPKETSPGGASHDFITEKIKSVVSLRSATFEYSTTLPKFPFFIKAIEHIPKA